MDNMLLSIILIAKKNTTRSFLKALGSILAQAYSPIEILIVDTNEPSSLYSHGLKEDLASYPQVNILQAGAGGTLSSVRNLALSRIRGDFVGFLGGNDEWAPEKAQKQIDFMQKSGCAACCANGVLADEHTADIRIDPFFQSVTDEPCRWLLDRPVKSPSQMIYRTDSLREIGGFDGETDVCGDLDAVLRLSADSKVLFLQESLCKSRILPEDIDLNRRTYKDCQLLFEKYIDIFLLNRSACREYYALLMYLAFKSRLWGAMLTYLLLSVLKSPLYSLFQLVRTAKRTVLGISRILFRSGILAAHMLRFYANLRAQLREERGTVKNRGASAGTVPLCAPLKEGGDAPFVFPSARAFRPHSLFAFACNPHLHRAVLPENAVSVSYGMFFHCKWLTSVIIPSTVTAIGPHAFQDCPNLRTVKFEPGSRLSSLGAYAFAGCQSLTEIYLPNMLASIGTGAFAGCGLLADIYCSDSAGKEGKAQRVLPSALTRIPRYAFAGCESLTFVAFDPGSMLKKVESGAFSNCARLRSILLTGPMDSIGAYAFFCCGSLETLIAPYIDNVAFIGKKAFMNCKNLLSFQLPTRLTRIEERTFSGCSRLKIIKVPISVVTINRYAFAECPGLEKVIVSGAGTAIEKDAFDAHTQIAGLGKAQGNPDHS